MLKNMKQQKAEAESLGLKWNEVRSLLLNKEHKKQIEKKLERGLVVETRYYGGLCIKLWAVSFTGLPDRLVLLPGGVIRFVEVKTAGKKPTARQLYVHKQLTLLGFKVVVLDHQNKFDEIFTV